MGRRGLISLARMMTEADGKALRPLVVVTGTPDGSLASAVPHGRGAAGHDAAMVAAGLRSGLHELLRSAGITNRRHHGAQPNDHGGSSKNVGLQNVDMSKNSQDPGENKGFVVHERSFSFEYPTKKSATMYPQVRLQEMRRGLDTDLPQSPSSQITPLRGILAKAWMDKHEKLIPSVVLLVCRYETTDAQVGKLIGDLRQNLKQHSTLVHIMVVLFSENDVPSALEVPHKTEQVQQRVQILAREVKLPSQCIAVINSGDAAEGPLVGLARAVRSESNAYYSSKAVRVQQHLLRLSQQQMGRGRRAEAVYAANVRYNLKMAHLFEATFTFEKALKHHEVAYLACIELATRKIATHVGAAEEEFLFYETGTYPAMEIKSLAEWIHLRLCYLRLFSSQSTKAILAQFDRHMASFRNLTGPSSLIFQHWMWMSRQHTRFAQLIQELRTAVSMSGLSPLDRARLQVAYHLRLAARFAVQRREAAQMLGISGPHAERTEQLKAQEQRMSEQHHARIEPSLYIGAYPEIVVEGAAPLDSSAAHSLIQCAIYLEEAKCDQGEIALDLLQQVLEKSTETNKDARSVRQIAGIRARIGCELVQRGETELAMKDLLHAAHVFNREHWFTLAEPVLCDIINSAEKLTPGNATFDIDAVSERRKVMHSALRLLSMRRVPASQKEDVTKKLLKWLGKPVRRAEDPSTPDGARLKLAFSLDDLEEPPIQWFAWFDQREAAVGDTVQLHVRIRSTFHVDTHYQTLCVIFNQSRYEVTLGDNIHFASNEEKIFQVSVQLHDLEDANKDHQNQQQHAQLGQNQTGIEPQQGETAMAASPTVPKAGVPLTPLRLQLKLVSDKAEGLGSQVEPPPGYTMLSAVSLWASACETASAPLHSSGTVLNLINNTGPQPIEAASPRRNKASILDAPNEVQNKSKQHESGITKSTPKGRLPRTLIIYPFESDVQISLQHEGFALVGEMFSLEVHLTAGKDVISGGQLFVACDPPLQSKSTPFFFNEQGEPLTLSSESLQPVEPLKHDVQMNAGGQSIVRLACRFSSLPFSASAADGRRQARTCIVSLDYALPQSGIQVRACKSFEIPCCLPFQTRVNLIPRNPQLPSALSVNAPCTVDLDLMCPREPQIVERIQVVDIRVEPSESCVISKETRSPLLTPRKDEGTDKSQATTSTSILPAPVTMHGGDRLSLGFEISTSAAGDNTTLGYVAVTWRRREEKPDATMYVPLPKLRVEHTQFYFSLSTNPEKTRRVGEAMVATINIQNASEIAQELDVLVEKSPYFFMAGTYFTTLILAPMQSTQFKLNLVPLLSGNLQLPNVTVESKRLKAKYTVPSPTESMIFVAP